MCEGILLFGGGLSVIFRCVLDRSSEQGRKALDRYISNGQVDFYRIRESGSTLDLFTC